MLNWNSLASQEVKEYYVNQGLGMHELPCARTQFNATATVVL